ncbi:MAG: NAD-dependent epimerase/dehydratase family protein [Opitutaceae bacterium]
MSPDLPLPKKILLTGGRARLAACIRPHLEAAGRELTMLSREGSNGFLPLEDLFETPLIDSADTLLHLAWSTLPATSEQNVGTEWENDLPLLFRILRRMVASPRRKDLHFIFFSSGGAVYGPCDSGPVNETVSSHPIGWYARAKLAAEEIIRGFCEEHGLRYTILRVSNPYGFSVPFQRVQGIIPHAIDCARSGKTLALWGDGSARKDFVHYTDFNRALQLVIDQRLTGTYNLSSGRSHTIREVIELVQKILGRTINIEAGPARTWDVHSSMIDNQKLRDATGWSPQVSLEEGLRLSAGRTGF